LQKFVCRWRAAYSACCRLQAMYPARRRTTDFCKRALDSIRAGVQEALAKAVGGE
jgi:hypothetical protein